MNWLIFYLVFFYGTIGLEILILVEIDDYESHKSWPKEDFKNFARSIAIIYIGPIVVLTGITCHIVDEIFMTNTKSILE